MNGDDTEIAEYVESLLEHGIDCESEDCPACQTLQGIFELVKKRLFTSSLFPDVAVSVTAGLPGASQLSDVAVPKN